MCRFLHRCKFSTLESSPRSVINSKWITDINVKFKTIKILEDNIRKNLDVLGYGDDCMGRLCLVL